MTISVEAKGLTFSFPDGTTTAQIGEAIDGYFAKNHALQDEGFWSGVKHGTAEASRNLEREAESMVPGLSWVRKAEEVLIPGFEKMDKAIETAPEELPKPVGWKAEIGNALPQVAASIPGWEAGAGAGIEMAERYLSGRLPGVLNWAARKGAQGFGGTLGGDLTSGEEITPDNVLTGGGVNILLESIFHTPQALKLMKVMLAKNGTAIQEAADHIGINPSMGVTSGRAWVRTLENLIQKVPGGHLLNIQNAKSLATMDSFIEGIKSKLGYQGDASALGRELKAAIDKAEKQFADESEVMYGAIQKRLPFAQMTNTRRFTRLIEEMNGVNPREGVHEMSVPPIARKYFNLIEKAGKIPQNTGYSNVVMSVQDARNALKILDDYIGTGESAAADTAAAKRMAKALRADIGGTLEVLGLGREWRAAQDHYAAGIALLEQARSVFGRAETGDAIYTRLFGGEAGAFSPKGADTLAPLKKVMTPGEWGHLTAEVVHRLGLEGAGIASAEGRKFNPNVFLTNWNKISDPAKELLFDSEHRYDLDQLAKLSEGFKNLGRDANHSNTAHHMAAMGMVGMAANPASWPLLAATLAGSTLGAKLLINPKATRLLVDAAYATEPNQVQQWLIKVFALVAANPELAEAFANLGEGDN